MARILVADDEPGLREFVADALELDGHVCVQAPDGRAAAKLLDERGFDLVITDLKMPGLDGMALLRKVRAEQPEVEVIVMTAHGTVDNAVEAMKLGAFEYLQKPMSGPDELRLLVSRAVERRGLRDRVDSVGHIEAAGPPLTYGDPAMKPVVDAIEKVARTNATVLLLGESGTGKEVAARSIHAQSPRAVRPFMAINCAALSETLLESELFGHEKGAFTGAIKQKLGRFELADGGTLFLDEVGDVPPSMQVKLLRALQEQEFERVGGEAPIKVDVRVVSATNKDLEAEVAAGRFRQDLYFRLVVLPVKLPPLRERREDIPPLVQHFIAKLGPKTNPRVRAIGDAALGRIMAYHWPGNVRELENAIEQALVFAEGEEIQPAALPQFLQGGAEEDRLDVPREMTLPEILDDLERQLILKAYAKAGQVKTETARLLGIKTSALYYKLEKYGIE
jgi:two-component system response regulator HydG